MKALSASAQVNNCAEKNGFYLLMSALFNASIEDNIENVKEIVDLMLALIKKNNDPAALMTALSSSIIVNDAYGINAFYTLAFALNNASVNNNSVNVKKIVDIVLELIKKIAETIIIMLIALKRKRLPEDTESFILKQKSKLSPSLKKHLSSIGDADTLRMVTASDTILGALIDYDRNPVYGFFKGKKTKTATREWVDKLLAEPDPTPLRSEVH